MMESYMIFFKNFAELGMATLIFFGVPFILSLFIWLVGLCIVIALESFIPKYNVGQKTVIAGKILFAVSYIMFIPLGIYLINSKITNVDDEKVYGPVKIERFILVDFRPPKHAYITLKHIETNIVYENKHVGKHCNTHPKVNEQYNVTVRPWNYKKDPSKVFWDFTNLNQEFCS